MGDAERERSTQSDSRNQQQRSQTVGESLSGEMAEARRVYPVELHPLGPWPLLIGLEGPPGSGKTFSSLRLARGIQSVRPGPIRLIDTEAGRSAAYREHIDFGMVRLNPPYRPTRFLSCIKELIAIDNPSCIIIDSLSSEHEDAGGVLDWHEQEVTRRVGKGNEENWAARERHSMAAWIVPKADRKQLMNGLLHILTPIICTFRAREKTKPVRDPKTGKTVPTQMGYVAIAPAEICFNLTCMCLLPPNAEGHPTWKSAEAEGFLLKRPIFLADALTEAQLDEATGAALANWAQGTAPTVSQATTGDTAAAGDGKVRDLEAMLYESTKHGYEVFVRTWNLMTRSGDWRGLSDVKRTYLRDLREGLISMARDVDAKQQEAASGAADV